MKTTIKRTMHYGLVCLLLCLLAGCKKAPMNSNIEGFWQLLEFTTQADGETHPCNRIYYSIQLWVAEVSERGGDLGASSFRGRYRYDEETNTVTLKEMSTYATPENSRPATREELHPFGLDSTDTTFDVIKADGKSLILKSDYATLTLKRF
ncbi:lipocalin-like domain-containing protein [Phocaeicola coprophilus]|uniref:lipocalin-like domain-containing protein n=1 Tax=Phocaeicola coprophilus TaxID=387090 RepID=UPI0040274D0A